MASKYQVPYGWDLKKLEAIGDFKNGINKSKEDFGHGVPFVNLMDVFGLTKIGKKKLDLVNAKQSEIELYSLQKGDVLFVRSSVKPTGVGLTTLVNEDLNSTVYSGFLIRFRDGGKLDHEFKRYCFHASYFRKRLLSLSTISANTNINQQSLSILEVLLPPLEEQRKIAEILSTWDDAIALTENLISTKQKLKKGLLEHLLSGEFRFSKYKKSSWDLIPFKKCTKFVRDGTHGTHKRISEGIPLLSAKDIGGNGEVFFDDDVSRISENDYKKIHSKYEIQENDLLLTVVGSLGRRALVSSEYPRFTLQRSVAIIRFKDSILPSFAFHYVGTSLFQKDLKRRANVTAQPGVYLKEIEKLKIPLIAKEEQAKISLTVRVSESRKRYLEKV